MDKELLLIGDTNSFMVKAMANNLKNVGYQVTTTPASVIKLKSLQDPPEILLYYISEGEKIGEVMKLLASYAEQGLTKLCLIGGEFELATACGSVPKEDIAVTFKRPVNIKELGEQLDDILIAGKILKHPKAEKKRILIVDDDGTMLRTINSWLSDEYKVIMISSGRDALEFLSSTLVDLVLLDYEMPDMNGPQVLTHMREDPFLKKVPVIFLTGKGDRNSVMTGISLKPEGYILKSVGPEEVKANIAEFFRLHPGNDEA